MKVKTYTEIKEVSVSLTVDEFFYLTCILAKAEGSTDKVRFSPRIKKIAKKLHKDLNNGKNILFYK